jgi:O-methyltransferase involved in polyketide biosynthesis
LAEEDVRKTLRDIRTHAPPGSVVVADFYSEWWIGLASQGPRKKALEYTDEGLGFGLPFATDREQTLRSFLESEGFEAGETFFMGTTGKKGPFVVVAEARV